VSDYRVYAKRSVKRLKQRFYVSIVASNGEKLFTSELYRDRDHAVKLGQAFAAQLDGNFVNLT
jgi:uncharacterized protein YegP (UPF0339 family)